MGTSLIVTAAMTAANIALNASRQIEGPRLTDTSASLADYGTSLNYLLGQRVVSCPAIFCKEIREKKKTRKGKSGKQVEYTGYGTWAVHVADHAIAGIGKIWFDNHLVYDATGGEEEIYPLADDYDLEASLRIYTGSETQLPDPDMQAYIEARDGAGTCPAYRGTSYIYFENIPLEMLGNRFPQVEVLVRTTSPAVFRGWYAKARIQLINPSTTLPSLGFYVEPEGAEFLSYVDDGFFWLNTVSDEFPDGIPQVAIDEDGYGATLYWCQAAVLGAREVDLRLQFLAGTVDGDMRASFTWQFWDGAASAPLPGTSTILKPGTVSHSTGNPFDVRSIWPDNWYFAISGDGALINPETVEEIGGAEYGNPPPPFDDVLGTYGWEYVHADENGLTVEPELIGDYFFGLITAGVYSTIPVAPGTTVLFEWQLISSPSESIGLAVYIGYIEYDFAGTIEEAITAISNETADGYLSAIGGTDFALNPYPTSELVTLPNTGAYKFFIISTDIGNGVRRRVTMTDTSASSGDSYYDAGDDSYATLEQLLTLVCEKSGLDSSDYDWSAVSEHIFTGYNWTQGTGKQIVEAVLDLFDVDVRPHDFLLEAVPRGGASQGSLDTAEFHRGRNAGDPPFKLTDVAESDLVRRVFLIYADASADQEANVAYPVGAAPDSAGSEREASIDMQTLALYPDVAQSLAERRQRRERWSRWSASFGLTRRRLALEPGDVWTPVFDGDAMTMRCTRLEIGADGVLQSEWERDDPGLAVLPASTGSPMAGYNPVPVPGDIGSIGTVLDVPLLSDTHDQSAPLAYLVAGPGAPGQWIGADFAQSETGELDSYVAAWDGISAIDGAVIGTCAAALPAALPWVPDMGSSISVTINAGELTAATLDDLLADATLNLAAVESESGWELVQFMTPTLTGAGTYTITGFLRGVRGTEWAIGGHQAGDRFILLDSAAKRRTMGAGELGDTDWYSVGSTGHLPNEDTAFSLTYSGASHRPLAPVHGSAVQSGNDWVFDATRRTRIGGASLDNQDVPLGEASESWSLDILDGSTVVRTITGVSLPLTYAEADQVTDFGAAQGTISAALYQVNPTLSLRGFPLTISA